MVKLASTLPKEHESNGLEQNSRHLIQAYRSQDTIPVIALIRTKDCTDTEDFTRVPRVEIVAIEGAFNDDDADSVRSLLVSLHDDRVRHVKQPLDLPEDDEPVLGNPLELEAGDVVGAELIDEGPLELEAGDVIDAELVDEEA